MYFEESSPVKRVLWVLVRGMTGFVPPIQSACGLDSPSRGNDLAVVDSCLCGKDGGWVRLLSA